MPRAADDEDPPQPRARRVTPLNQKQEDLLIELFVQLSLAERRKVIKLCRDLLKAAQRD